MCVCPYWPPLTKPDREVEMSKRLSFCALHGSRQLGRGMKSPFLSPIKGKSVLCAHALFDTGGGWTRPAVEELRREAHLEATATARGGGSRREAPPPRSAAGSAPARGERRGGGGGGERSACCGGQPSEPRRVRARWQQRMQAFCCAILT